MRFIGVLTVFLTTASASAEPAKVLVVPYEGINRRVDRTKLDESTRLLTAQLETDGFDVVVAGRIEAAVAESTEALRTRAEALESERRVVEAIAVRHTIVARTRAPTAYARAQTDLARALFWAGEDETAEAAIDIAARVAPALPLAQQTYSRWLRSRFAAAVKRAGTERRGRLHVRVSMPHPRLTLDGAAGATAPVRFDDVVPGRHVLTIEDSAGSVVHRFVDVPTDADRTIEVEVSEVVGGPTIGAIAAAVAGNEITEDTITAAVVAAMRENASFVVLGGLYPTRHGFEAYTFVVDVEHRAIARLGVAKFDAELLTTEVDVLAVTDEARDAIRDRVRESKGLGRAIVAGKKADEPNRVKMPWPEPTETKEDRPPRVPFKNPFIDLDESGALDVERPTSTG